jgi:DNA-binding transcriptional regulator GbsR (MarR family)
MLTLTPLGEQKLEGAINLLTPRGAVLSLLYEVKQGMELEDLIEQTHMSEAKAATVMRSLINDGLVQET